MPKIDLDLNKIITAARLRNHPMAGRNTAIVRLHLALLASGHESQLRARPLLDPGRSGMSDIVLAIEYHGEMWGLHGPGGWDKMMDQALRGQGTTWKNPTMGDYDSDAHEMVISRLTHLAIPNPSLTKRIYQAISEAEAMALQSDNTHPTVGRPSPRL